MASGQEATNFQAKYSYEYLLYPVSGAYICYLSYGPYGAAVGFGLGSIDSIATGLNFYEAPYLTGALLGSYVMPNPNNIKLGLDHFSITQNYVINYSVINFVNNNPLKLAGAAFGVIAANIDLNVARVQSFLSAVMFGHSYGKTHDQAYAGAGLGVIASAIDEYLVRNNITENYNLAPAFKNTITYISASKFIFNYFPVTLYKLLSTINHYTSLYSYLPSSYLIPIYTPFATAYSASLPWFSNNKNFIIPALHVLLFSIMLKRSSLTKEEAAKKHLVIEANDYMYELRKGMIPDDRLKDLEYKQKTTIIVSQLLIFNLIIKADDYKSQIYRGMTSLVGLQETLDKFVKLDIVFVEVAIFTALHRSISFFATDRIRDYFSTTNKNDIENYFLKKLNSESIRLYLTHNISTNSSQNNVDTIIKNMELYLAVVTKDGNFLVTDGLSTAINGIFAAAYLYKHDVDINLFAYFYNQIITPIGYIIVAKEDFLAQEIIVYKSEIKSLIEFDLRNSIQAAESDSTNLSENKLSNWQAHLQKRESFQNYWNILIKIWQDGRSFIDFIIINKMTSLELVTKGHLSKSLWPVNTSIGKILLLFSWEDVNAVKLTKFKDAILHLMKLKKDIELAEKSSSLSEVRYSHNHSDKLSLCLKDLNIFIGEKLILFINDLCIDNAIIGVFGISGCGKSTLFRVLKKVDNANIWAKGEINYELKYSSSPIVLMASQKEVFYSAYTLLELITSKTGDLAQKQKLKVIELLKEIEIDPLVISKLDEASDWEKVLSGGNKQKVILIRVILKAINAKDHPPALILLDEIFKGMDYISVKKSQELIIKYLSGCIVLIIDHQLEHNNYLHSIKLKPILNQTDEFQSEDTQFKLVRDSQLYESFEKGGAIIDHQQIHNNSAYFYSDKALYFSNYTAELINITDCIVRMNGDSEHDIVNES